MPSVELSSNSLHYVLGKYDPGTLFLIRTLAVSEADDDNVQFWVCSGYHRHSGPAADMIFGAEFDQVSLRLQIQRVHETGLQVALHFKSFLGVLFRDYQFDKLCLSSAAVDMDRRSDQASSVYLAADWMHVQSPRELEFFPTSAVPKRPKLDKRLKDLKKGLKALGPPDLKPDTVAKESAVKLVFPAPAPLASIFPLCH